MKPQRQHIAMRSNVTHLWFSMPHTYLRFCAALAASRRCGGRWWTTANASGNATATGDHCWICQCRCRHCRRCRFRCRRRRLLAISWIWAWLCRHRTLANCRWPAAMTKKRTHTLFTVRCAKLMSAKEIIGNGMYILSIHFSELLVIHNTRKAFHMHTQTHIHKHKIARTHCRRHVGQVSEKSIDKGARITFTCISMRYVRLTIAIVLPFIARANGGDFRSIRTVGGIEFRRFSALCAMHTRKFTHTQERWRRWEQKDSHTSV